MIEVGGAPRAFRIACGPVAGYGHNAAVGRDSANAVVLVVGDINVARPVERHAVRLVELSCSNRTAGSIDEPGSPVPGERSCIAAGSDLADGMVQRIGDVDLARVVHGHTAGPVELGGSNCATCAVDKARRPVACKRAGAAVRRDLAHAIAVRDIDVAKAVDRYAAGSGELGSSSRAAGSVKEPLGAVAGKRGR